MYALLELVQISIRIMSASLLQGVFLLDATFTCINMCIYKKLAKSNAPVGNRFRGTFERIPIPKKQDKKDTSMKLEDNGLRDLQLCTMAMRNRYIL